jgi:chitodextrinase
VSLHFTSAATSATARLISNDSFISVASGSVNLETRSDRTSVARFSVAVATNVPSNHTAALTIEVQSPPGTVVNQAPIRLPVAPSFLPLELPFAHDRVLLPVPNGRHVLVADDSGDQEGPTDRVYATFRNSDGSFTPVVVLSDTSRNARRPQAVVAPNGDVHVVYSQFVATLDFAGFPAYTSYSAATGQWAPSTLFTNGAQVTRIGERNTSIALDSSGTVHLAFATTASVVTMRRVGGVWGEPVSFPVTTSEDTREVRLVNTSSGLKLFVRPVLSSFFGAPTFDRRMFLLEYNGTTWSPPVEVTGVGPGELAHLPFVFSGTARRFYQPAASGLVRLAQLNGTSWSSLTSVRDIGNVDFIRGFFGLQLGSSSFASYLSRPVAATQGSTRELVQGSVTSPLSGDRKLRAALPFVTRDTSARFHIFNQELELFRIPGFGTFAEFPSFTRYYTTAPLAAAALPTVPIVVDDGATTSSDRELHASWSSSHGAGIASYRVAWGTVPGGTDILPWQETTATQGTFDLGDQRLLPGQTLYASVQARSAALLSSDIGVSDGITVALGNRCTAPPWNSTVVYHDVGTLVTYQGATWSNQYWQSNQIPGASGSYAWAFVAECTGEPILPPCTAPAWNVNQKYVAGDRVSHNGFEFENLWPSIVPPDGTAGNPWKWVATCQP